METKNNWKAWLYLAPTIILMLIFTIYPLFNTIIISFLDNYEYTSGSFAGTTFTFNNYLRIFGRMGNSTGGGFFYDGSFVEYALINTLIIVFVTVPASVLIALLIAVGLNSIKVFNKIFQTIFFIPYVTNSIAIGMVFAVMFNKDYGLINSLFGVAGKNWIDIGADRWDAMTVLCIYIVWHALPYKILIFLSGLQGIDKQYYQAAKIDATPKWKTFWRITVPLLSPQIAYVCITSFIGSFKEYSSIKALLNNPGPNGAQDNSLLTIVYYIYNGLAQVNTVSMAAAAAVILLLIILFFTFINLYVSSKKVHY